MVLGEAEPSTDESPGAAAQPTIEAVQQRLDARWETSELRSALLSPSLAALGRYLAEPDVERWKRAVFTQLLGEFDPKTMDSSDLAAEFEKAIMSALPESATDFLATDGGSSETSDHDTHRFAGRGAWRSTGPDAPPATPTDTLADLLLALPPTALKRFDPDAMRAAVHLHDDDPSRLREDFQAAWNRVLRLFNLLQFLPLSWWTTRLGMEANLYDELPTKSQPWLHDASIEPDTACTWPNALRLAADELHTDLVHLREQGAPAPEPGFELADARGAVLGEAELAWPSHLVAVLVNDHSADRVIFESRGWRVLLAPVADLADSIAALLAGETE